MRQGFPSVFAALIVAAPLVSGGCAATGTNQPAPQIATKTPAQTGLYAVVYVNGIT